MAVAVLTLLTLIVVAVTIPESPRYFLAKHNYKEARRSYRRIAKMSGKEMFHEELLNEGLFTRLSQG